MAATGMARVRRQCSTPQTTMSRMGVHGVIGILGWSRGVRERETILRPWQATQRGYGS